MSGPPVVTMTGKAADVDGVWKGVYASLDAWAGQSIRIHLMAVDGSSNSLVEVEIDDAGHARGLGRTRRVLSRRSPGLRSLGASA